MPSITLDKIRLATLKADIHFFAQQLWFSHLFGAPFPDQVFYEDQLNFQDMMQKRFEKLGRDHGVSAKKVQKKLTESPPKANFY